ncbi:unnamed protein product [Rangifer tarandus platyrhynchus]|uniref:Uncharacterized protein n=1 Tax=Rangifer tarandus platyrhynchus TaxID=3082113 RepID=A0ABN8Y6P4_RANTA|nr:unnamed protein product [Rangifer tarandus platyrhynchus]
MRVLGELGSPWPILAKDQCSSTVLAEARKAAQGLQTPPLLRKLLVGHPALAGSGQVSVFHVPRETVRSGSLTFLACSPLLPQLPSPRPCADDPAARRRAEQEDADRIPALRIPASSSAPLGLGGWAARHETADAAAALDTDTQKTERQKQTGYLVNRRTYDTLTELLFTFSSFS